MALARLSGGRRGDSYTWPGFVDALATLLMVIIFVLMVFVLIQVNLAYRVSGQDATLSTMRQQIISLGELLNIERKASADLSADLAQITSQLAIAESDKAELADQLNAAIASSDDLTAQLLAASNALTASQDNASQISALQQQTESALATARVQLSARLAAMQAMEATLADADTRLTTAMGRISELETKDAASRREVAQMTKALAALRLRIEELNQTLADREAESVRQKVAIASLGQRLNNALASRVQELKKFRSEFFGRLSEILKGRDNVQIVGDRFVFQSEVLFARGQASIGAAGEEQLSQLATALAEITAELPSDINWVLQVDGHTDDVPITAGRFADNWDLSTERALSVVRFLAQNGVPSSRLAATGYGEFQPLDAGDNEDARRRNRRIELKITQRVAAKN